MKKLIIIVICSLSFHAFAVDESEAPSTRESIEGVNEVKQPATEGMVATTSQPPKSETYNTPLSDYENNGYFGE